MEKEIFNDLYSRKLGIRLIGDFWESRRLVLPRTL